MFCDVLAFKKISFFSQQIACPRISLVSVPVISFMKLPIQIQKFVQYPSLFFIVGFC
jgi:hypothetical protein